MTDSREIPYCNQPFMAEALAFVYMAQYVRSDGPSRAGVLVHDCRAYSRELHDLESKGDVTRLNWVNLKGFGTTPQGAANAHKIMESRLDFAMQRLSSDLDGMPKRVAHYLLSNLVLAPPWDVSSAGRVVQIKRSSVTEFFETHGMLGAWCLLMSPEILDHRNRFLDSLENMQLAVRASDYVSTNGGELRDQIYVLAPELEVFSREYLRTSGVLCGRLWPPDLEDRHSVFHLLGGARGSVQLLREVVDREVPVRLRKEVCEFVAACVSDGLLVEVQSNAGACYRTSDSIAYQGRLEDCFWEPLVGFLLQNQPTTNNSPDTSQKRQDQPSVRDSTVPNTSQAIVCNDVPKAGWASSTRERLLDCLSGEYSVEPPDQEWLNLLASVLQSIMNELGVGCTVNSRDFEWGPRFVRANVRLSKGRRIKEVMAVSTDIANKVFAQRELFKPRYDDEVPKNVRVESVPAKAMVGIYIPRNDFQAVPIGGLLGSLPKSNSTSFVLGMNTIGQPQYSNLNSMPHLLVSGQPGAGKSVFLNSMIMSLALQNEPSRLRFVLVDPKGGLEFGPYKKLPHVAQIAADTDEALEALSSSRKEMDDRYNRMTVASEGGSLVRSIDEYNKVSQSSLLAYQVVMIDEFADLVLSDHRKRIIELVQAIAQKGRAAGIYMVICTQQPRVNVIPGGIKAVIPSRLSFRLPTGTDSKVILDETGAEDLMKGGDMFLKEPSHPGLRRFQCPMVTNEEIARFVGAAAQIWGTGG